MYSKEAIKRFRNPKFAGEIKNPDAVGEDGNMKCIMPNEKIFTNNKFTDIKKVKKREEVISHKGIKNKISDKFSRKYNGKIITLKNTLGKISLTEDHLIYAIKLPNHNKYYRTKHKKDLFPAWYHANELKKRDIILYPVYKEIEDRKSIKFEVIKSKWDFKSKRIPKNIPLNNNFLRLIGYFLAEGHISEGKCINYITMSFNINETEYIEDVKKIVKKLFKIDVKVREIKSKNVKVIHIYHAGLARFFKKQFNKGAKNKAIPEIFLKLPPNKQKYLIEGLWKGDGYINLNRDGQRAGYSTISYQLAQQIKILLIRQKIVPSIYLDKEKRKNGINHQEAYRIHIGQRDSLNRLCKILKIKYYTNSKYISETSWFDDNFLYTPITKITKEKYNGKVYNLEIESSHSFISEGFCLHNCGDVMKIYLKIKDDKIVDIKFQTYGCIGAISSSEAMCELAKGKKIKEALNITHKDIVNKLKGLPTEKIHCSVLGTIALKKAIDNYEKTKNNIKNKN